MAIVRTVLGEIDHSALGHCQMHEHLFVSSGPATDIHPALRIDDEARSTEELVRYRAAGGTSVLDAQPGGAGRNAQALARMSRASGISIIASTGFHLPMFYPSGHWRFTESESQVHKRFSEELTQGIVDEPGATPIRAGAVKAALGAEGCAGRSAALLRSAARAAAEANVPLLLHTEKGVGGAAAVRLCAECGLPESRVLVCHVDRQADDLSAHERVADTGAFLEYDTIGRFKYHDDESECRLIRHMIDRGHKGQLLLSLDTTAERLKSYGGGLGLDYLLNSFLPMLLASGISEADIWQITRENPQQVFR